MAARSWASQARGVLRQHLDLSSRHQAKLEQGVRGSRSTGRIHSLRTFDKRADSLTQAGRWAEQTHGISRMKHLTPEMAQEYLAHRAEQGYSQKQLDADRNALEFIVGRGSLERVHSQAEASESTRSYTPEQVRAVAAAQTERNALATEISYAAGLRGHELLTLERADRRAPSSHRDWSPDRFEGRGEGVRYTVEGKGGLIREVHLPADLAERLEARRLDEPRTVSDRGIHHQQHYDIGGGNSWEKSFSRASIQELGWSNGAHGLRHSYAQERMAELQDASKEYYDARELVSEEMGHFRGDVTETYLR